MSGEPTSDSAVLLEGLLELADQAGFELRVVSTGGGATSAPLESSVARLGERILVVLSPADPPGHQARVIAQALKRYRSDFIEERFIAPALRDFLENVDPR